MASTMQLTVAAFVQSLYDMVTSKADGLIDWTADGRSFVIRVCGQHTIFRNQQAAART